jgi:8-oxo-dGTP diphosphatase
MDEPTVGVGALPLHPDGCVLARATARDAAAATPEPEIFDKWAWVVPGELPRPLFPASAVLIAAWQGRSTPARWAGYLTGTPAAYPVGGRQ